MQSFLVRTARSLQRNARFGDPPAPFIGLGFDERAKFLRRRGCRIDADLGETLPECRIGERLLAGRVQLGDDDGGRAGRDRDSVPAPGFETRNASFRDSWHIWCGGNALVSAGAERPLTYQP